MGGNNAASANLSSLIQGQITSAAPAGAADGLNTTQAYVEKDVFGPQMSQDTVGRYINDIYKGLSPSAAYAETTTGSSTASTPTGGGSGGGGTGGATGGASNFNVIDLTTGQTSTAAGTPLPGGQDLFADITPDSLNITANVPSAFIQSGTGNDILSAAAGGNNVLDDTGGQVNFEIGSPGAGSDVFFLDARHDPVSWNTISNFHAGDAAIIWGIAPQDLTTFAADGMGVPGFQGLTLRTFQNGGASYLTIAGYSTADLASGRLVDAVGTASDGSSYLLVQAH